MSMVTGYIIVAVSGYLLGSINSALLVSRLLKRDDIRKYGSGNAGATNMFRVYGKMAALFTILGDFFKAALAVLLARLLFSQFGLIVTFDIGYFAGLFVIAGHVFPLYFKFSGGKGVMPAVGIILVVNPIAFLVLLILAIPVFLLKRTMSIVSLTNAILLPFVILLIGLIQSEFQLVETILTLLYSALVLFSHRSNIIKLIEGKEKPTLPPRE